MIPALSDRIKGSFLYLSCRYCIICLFFIFVSPVFDSDFVKDFEDSFFEIIRHFCVIAVAVKFFAAGASDVFHG